MLNWKKEYSLILILNFIGAVFTVVLSVFLENIGLFRR